MLLRGKFVKSLSVNVAAGFPATRIWTDPVLDGAEEPSALHAENTRQDARLVAIPSFIKEIFNMEVTRSRSLDYR
jgi:hypothetical protein